MRKERKLSKTNMGFFFPLLNCIAVVMHLPELKGFRSKFTTLFLRTPAG